MSITIEQFVERLTQSGLMSAQDLDFFQKQLPPERQPKDVQQLAQALVQQGKLTKYQAQAVYQGKVKGLVFGEYVVLDKLGEGGMGVVLKAQHRRMKRFVAVKMISRKSIGSPDAVKRFYREVEAAAKLNHSNIVQAYDASERDGIHYLVMEYVEGKDLAAIVKDRGPMAVHAAVECVLQAARGLQYAHKQGIVHRDIKPSNLLMDKDGTVKILDMGLARVAGLVDEEDKDRITQSGQVMGTLDYMAPEQAMDTHHADARADIYSLGCTLYRLLTGDAMYKGETLAKIIWAHQQGPIPSLCKARSEVPPQLDAVFQKMVAKKPEDRYQTMTEVIAEMETCGGKMSAPATSFGDEATATFQAKDNLSLLPEASPCSAVTAAKQQVEKLAAATLSQQAVAAETSKQLTSDEKLQTLPRKKKTLTVGIGLGLLGAIGAIAIAVIIHIRRDGKDTNLTVPDGSQVTVGRDGNVDLTVPESSPRALAEEGQGVRVVDSAPPPAIAPFDEKKAKEHRTAWAKYLGVPVEMTNSIGMKLVLIPPGEFEMGSTSEEVAAEIEGTKDKGYSSRAPAEVLRHRVKITKPFYLAPYQVTQGEYESVMGVNPSSFTEKQMDVSVFKSPLSEADVKYRLSHRQKMESKDTSRYPVETVKWDDCVEFGHKLSAIPAEQAAGRVYRLPSEAEWEYACRAGTTTRWSSGADEAGFADVAWFSANSGGMTHPVGEKKPNAWGLHDMHGNVEQWCMDWFGQSYYKQSPSSDPSGPPAGSCRVLRGGTWRNSPSACRSAFRDSQRLPPFLPSTVFGWWWRLRRRNKRSKQLPIHQALLAVLMVPRLPSPLSPKRRPRSTKPLGPSTSAYQSK